MSTDWNLTEALDRAATVAEEHAIEVDRTGSFPRRSIEALAETGLLGLISSTEVGGRGEGLRAAATVIERLARSCASTAMVTLMHYCGTAVVEAYGPRRVREEIAAGRHLTTLAFSEAGSRSQFWTPLSTATRAGEEVRLNARKSWVTSAGEADSYIWSSRPLEAEGLSTIWLVPAGAPGLALTGGFDGLGMRGNASRPITATEVTLPPSAMLGPDGGGLEIMMGTVLPWFQVLNAASSLGIAEAAVARTVAHASATRLEHLGQTLADQPMTRAHLARMRMLVDQARGLFLDTLAAIESQREDASLRVLEVKPVASEAAVATTDLAMRVCGGAAFRKEVGVERNFRDARAATVMAPTTDALHEFIGRAVCGLPVF
ncbi:MAG TPA: acyl-CoA dehydrogenase family protein [Candidatus Dormibacteraeota bacterium]|nr:acyl-CoA dehydrogenase family protein [Candidatus Dormibacteraeota bacterium]